MSCFHGVEPLQVVRGGFGRSRPLCLFDFGQMTCPPTNSLKHAVACRRMGPLVDGPLLETITLSYGLHHLYSDCLPVSLPHTFAVHYSSVPVLPAFALGH